MSRRIADYHTFVDMLATLLASHSKETGLPVTCARGCSACCYEPVYVYEKEARHLFDGIPAEHLEEVKAKVVEWHKQFISSAVFQAKEPGVVDYLRLRLPCPLLHENQCLVYDRRPTGCRLHLALGPKTLCENLNKRLTQRYAQSPEGSTMVGVAALEACKGRLEADHLGVFLFEFVTGLKAPSPARLSGDIEEKKRTVSDSPDAEAVVRQATDKVFAATAAAPATPSMVDFLEGTKFAEVALELPPARGS